jgi:hypothetical protein
LQLENGIRVQQTFVKFGVPGSTKFESLKLVPLVTREKSTLTWSASFLSDHGCRKEEKRSEISGCAD